MLSLDTPLRFVKGIGPQRALALRRKGYETVEDLLLHLPIHYEDRRRFAPLAELGEGVRAAFLAKVRAPRLIRTRRRGFTIFNAALDDGTAVVPAVWFNQPYLERSLVEGRPGFFYGELRRPRTGRGPARFENPQFEPVDPADPEPVHAGRIVPVYEKIGSLTGRMIRSLIHRILEPVGGAGGGADGAAGGAEDGATPRAGLSGGPECVPGAANGGVTAGSGGTALPGPCETAFELIPAEVLRRNGLPDREQSLRLVHFPADGPLDALNRRATPHHRRLIFEEFFLLQLGIAQRRDEALREERGFLYETTPEIREKLKGILPFRLTPGQRGALREIVGDLRSPHPMNRLLQGDVGSGKTIVAVLAMALAAENGLQSALMAPTEILAEQHARSLGALLEPAGYRLVLLTSAAKGRARAERLAALASGEAHMAVGTHALVQKGVAFRRLGLVVIDEQHRFGVMQRATLREKGLSPDTLVMTATPIPRTLALTVYGDLDTSMIADLPPGRGQIRTFVREEGDRGRLYEWMRREIASGRQAFVVYPLIEESSTTDLRAAKAMARRLAADVFGGFRVGLVHGGMRSEEKADVMTRFRDGEVSVLVATTVVEVGIDVPNATILVIEHAERFGLSQLHQLRGRIGRGSRESTCVLMAGGNPTEAARARLGAIEKESSGFRLAEIDLDLRGPGEVFGTRQSGLPDLRIGNLARDRDLMEAARREAQAMVLSGEGPRGARMRVFLERLRPAWRERFKLSRVG